MSGGHGACRVRMQQIRCFRREKGGKTHDPPACLVQPQAIRAYLYAMSDPSETPSGDETTSAPASESTEVGIGAIARRLGPASVLGVLWMLLPGIGGLLLIARMGTISEWLDAQGDLGIAIYIGVFIVSAGFGLLPTYAQAVLGGWVFGMAYGLTAALAGFTGASLIGYAITRIVARNRAESLIAENPRARAVREALIGRGFWPTLGIVTLLRVPPNSPFALTNLVMASSGVRLLPFALGTLIGMAPRTALVVGFAAKGAADGHRDIQSLIKDHGTLPVVAGIVVLVVVLSIIGRIANRAINRVVVNGNGNGNS